MNRVGRKIPYLDKSQAGSGGIDESATTKHEVGEISVIGFSRNLTDLIFLKAVVRGAEANGGRGEAHWGGT